MKKIFLFISLLFLQVNAFGVNDTDGKLDPFQEALCFKFIDLLEKNTVCEKDVKAVCDTLKSEGKIEDAVTAEKIKNIFKGMFLLGFAWKGYGYCKYINCYSNIMLSKLRANDLVDDIMISEITKFKKVEDDVYEERLITCLEGPNCTYDDREFPIEIWAEKHNKAQPLSMFKMVCEHTDVLNDSEGALLLNFEEKSFQPINDSDDLDEIKTEQFYNKLAEIFINDFFVKLSVEEQEKILSYLKTLNVMKQEERNFFDKMDTKLKKEIQGIYTAVYYYIAMNKLGCYSHSMVLSFESEVAVSVVLKEKLEILIENERKQFHKEFDATTGMRDKLRYFGKQAGIEPYDFRLVFVFIVEKEFDKLKNIILKKIK